LSALNYCPEKSGKNAGDWPIAFLRKPEKIGDRGDFGSARFRHGEKKKQNCEAGTETGETKKGE